MKKYSTWFAGIALLTALLINCKDTSPAFSTGAGDPRITGTWRLIERRFQRDSAFSVLTPRTTTKRDSVVVKVGNTTVKKDSVIIVTDTVPVRRDTTFYTTRRYAVAPPQTLTFGTDGSLSADGSEMTYYYPIKNFRVDLTYPDSLLVDLFISTNRANVPIRQGLEFRRDTLVLKPRCEQPCYSRFVRVR